MIERAGQRKGLQEWLIGCLSAKRARAEGEVLRRWRRRKVSRRSVYRSIECADAISDGGGARAMER
jgi:hypothetical protein